MPAFTVGVGGTLRQTVRDRCGRRRFAGQLGGLRETTIPEGSTYREREERRVCRDKQPRGTRVDHPDQVGDALREATRSGRPGVLEIMVTQELGDPFRRDALKKPVRRLEKYRDYGAA